MLKLISIALALGHQAFAADLGGSEYQHQAPVNRIEITPRIGYRNEGFRAVAPTGDFDIKGLRESVLFEYGLSETFSAGVWLGGATDQFHSTDPSRASFTRSGLFDPSVFIHGRHDHEHCSLRYGLGVNFALGKQQLDNNSSGGIALVPFVGYEMAAGPGVAGVRVSLLHFVGKRKFANSSTGKDEDLSGSTVLTPAFFYEMQMSPVKVGLALELNYAGETDEDFNGQGLVGQGDKHSSWDVALYAPYDVSPNLTLLPRFTYGEWNAFNTARYESNKTWQLEVGARFAF